VQFNTTKTVIHTKQYLVEDSEASNLRWTLTRVSVVLVR